MNFILPKNKDKSITIVFEDEIKVISIDDYTFTFSKKLTPMQSEKLLKDIFGTIDVGLLDCSNMPNEEFELINNYLEQGKLPPLNLKSKGTKGIHVHKNGWT